MVSIPVLAQSISILRSPIHHMALLRLQYFVPMLMHAMVIAGCGFIAISGFGFDPLHIISPLRELAILPTQLLDNFSLKWRCIWTKIVELIQISDFFIEGLNDV